MKTRKKYKLCRRLGPGVYEKCQTPKFLAAQKVVVGRKKAASDYGLQLIEKQKLRFGYGVSERQLRNYVREAQTAKGMHITDKLFELLESRLDNVVYRLGLAHTRNLARQMVSHGHILVNGTRTTIPSYRVREGDKVSIRIGSQKSPLFSNLDEKLKKYSAPTWLSFDAGENAGMVKGMPKNTEQFVDLGSVLEFYSR